MKSLKRLFSLAVALIMALSVMSVSAFAEDDPEPSEASEETTYVARS